MWFYWIGVGRRRWSSFWRKGKLFQCHQLCILIQYQTINTHMLNQLITHSSYLLVNLPCFRATVVSILVSVAAVHHPTQSLLVVAAAVLGLLQTIVLSSLFLPLKRSTNTNCKFIFQTAYMRIVYYSSCNRFRSNICHLVSIWIFFSFYHLFLYPSDVFIVITIIRLKLSRIISESRWPYCSVSVWSSFFLLSPHLRP